MVQDGAREGDLLLRGNIGDGFVLLDIVTGTPVCPQGLSLMDALAVAKTHTSAVLWHQLLDERGRPLTEPVRAPLVFS